MENLEELSLEGYEEKCLSVTLTSDLLVFIGCCFPAITIVLLFPYFLLDVLRNLLSDLSLPLCLAEMKVFDVSKNELTMISDGFLSMCTKLETLNASVNHLSKHIPF